jgi:glycerol-3-phosphate acyltransferase PlsY
VTTRDLLVVLVAYGLGAIPFAFLVPRYVAGVDVRRLGSRNVGAANVLRVTRTRTALLVMLLDVGKGALAVAGAAWAGATPEGRIAAGVAAVLGHVYPVWLGFRGGKGVATAFGVFLVLAPVTALLAAVVFTGVVWRTRYVSAGSLGAATVLFAGSVVTERGVPGPLTLAAAVVAVVLVWRHRGNIGRLRRGLERRLGQRAGRPGGGGPA